MRTPRLEFLAAIVGLRLTTSITRALDIPIRNVNFWSDSMDVLYWIRGRGKQFRPFVSNRVGEIQRLTNPEQWQYVESKENPADMFSWDESSQPNAKSTLVERSAISFDTRNRVAANQNRGWSGGRNRKTEDIPSTPTTQLRFC